MKAKFYLILTGLLMAACITSYGQETVSEFTLQKNGKLFWNNDLFENEDGSLESIDMGAKPASVFMLRVTMKDGTTYHEKILKE